MDWDAALDTLAKDDMTVLLAWADHLEETGHPLQAEGARWAYEKDRNPILFNGKYFGWYNWTSRGFVDRTEIPTELIGHMPGALMSPICCRWEGYRTIAEAYRVLVEAWEISVNIKQTLSSSS